MDIDNLVIVRGGGDIATGVIYALWNCEYKIIVLESENPSAIRRYVSVCEAVYDGESHVEDMNCKLCDSLDEALKLLETDIIPILIDPECQILKEIKPFALIDAILAKKNLGTEKDMASITISLGPGFTAGKDTDIVIETMRGHNLGRIIEKGSALPNTGVPGMIGGESGKRVIHSPAAGILKNIRKISDTVRKGDLIAEIITPYNESVPVITELDGILRGLIRDGYNVKKGFKIADVDPRLKEKENCFTISDKSRCLGGAVLQALGRMQKKLYTR